MAEVHYLISDASKQVDVESHVLRYWEDELELNIPRNDMGHRYYTEYHIRLFRQIKELKEKGYQLKAIKSALNKMAGVMEKVTIAENDMEENMKAAWNEGPVLKKEKADGQVKETAQEQKKEVSAKQSQSGAAKNSGKEAAALNPKTAQSGQAAENREPIKLQVAGGSGTVLKMQTSVPPENSIKGQRTDLPKNPVNTNGTSIKMRTQESAREQMKIHLVDNSQERSDSRAYGKKPGEAGFQEVGTVSKKEEVSEIDTRKMARLQSVMNHIIGQAMDANMTRFVKEVSTTVSEEVTDKMMKEVEYLMRVNDEKEEERFRQLDETIRTYQKQGKGRAETAATKIPFFKKKKFGKNGKKLF